MKISISENLKRLRITREVTQEALAEYVGVSAQSVSKWERGENFPDITLVPFIATFFDVTTDELLGMSAFRDEKRVEDVRTRIDEIALDESIINDEKQRLFRELWRELAHDMPNNDEVQLMWSGYLYGYGPEQGSEEEKREAIRLVERVLERSTDDSTRFSAIIRLSRFAQELGNIEKAREYANRLPSVTLGSREATLAQIAHDDINAYIRAQGVKYKFGGALDDSDGKLDRAKIEELIAPYRDGVAAYAQQTARLLWNFRYFEQLLGLATEEEFLRLWDFDLTLTELVHWQKPELDETLASNYINIVSAHFAAGNAEKVIEAVEKAAAYAEKIPIEQRNIGTKSGFDENGNGISRHFEENLREFLADFYMSATEDNDYLPHLGLHENPRLIDAIKRIRGTE